MHILLSQINTRGNTMRENRHKSTSFLTISNPSYPIYQVSKGSSMNYVIMIKFPLEHVADDDAVTDGMTQSHVPVSPIIIKPYLTHRVIAPAMATTIILRSSISSCLYSLCHHQPNACFPFLNYSYVCIGSCVLV